MQELTSWNSFYFAGKAYLKINSLVKTRLHEFTAVERSGLWAPDLEEFSKNPVLSHHTGGEDKTPRKRQVRMLPRFQASLLPFPVERESDGKREPRERGCLSSFAHLDNKSSQ